MFGYVMANKPELKIREYERYKGFYCGLCRQLKCRNGTLSRLTLTYDMTFLILFLSSLYEPKETGERHRCPIHPGKKQRMIFNAATEYAADMNVLLSYYHFQDDWADERKITGLCGARMFGGKAGKIAEQYPRQASVMEKELANLAELEKMGETRPDFISRPFGRLMGELFCWQEDAFQDILRRFGFFLGKYIYLLDACLDLEDDMKKDNFNPFCGIYQTDSFWDDMKVLLDGTMKAAIVEFEKFPLEQDLPLLRNILYEGVKIPLQKAKNEVNNDT